MNMPKHIARNARSAHGIDALGRRARPLPAAQGMWMCRCAVPSAGPRWLISGPRRSAPAARAIGERALFGVHAHHHGHAGPQQALAGDGGRHADAHRQPLHDLGEVSGGIVRRQQREHGAGGRREALDRALDRMLGQRIDRDRSRLAGAQARQLRFLEVGVDINLIERNEARKPLAGLHVIAGLHGAIADHAVDRRADDGERQIALGLGERGLEFIKRRDRLLLLALEHVDIGRRRNRWRLARLDAGDRLIAVGLRLLQQLAARGVARDQVILPVELQLRARWPPAWAETSWVLAWSTAACWAAI